MAENVGFSAVLNPVNPARVLIYRITPKKYTLGFDQRPIIGDTSVPRTNPDPALVKSTLLDPLSNVVALKFDDTVNVYGVVAETQIISLISPFVEPINPTVKSPNSVLAGTVAPGEKGSKDKAWVAYTGQTDAKVNIIYYSDVTTPKANNSQFAAKNVRDKTSLSLFHDTKRLWAIYQNVEGQLIAYNHKEQNPSNIYSDTDFFIKGTPICSIFIPVDKITNGNKASLGRVIVYWVRSYNGDPTLFRSHADIKAKNSTAVFSTPIPATGDAQIVHKTAQISVVMDKAEQCNRLYVAKAGEDNISQVTDSWVTDSDDSDDEKNGNKSE